MHIEVFRDRRGHWRWRLRAANGRIIAVPGEGYVNRADMEDSLENALYGYVRVTDAGRDLVRGTEVLEIEEVAR